MFAPVLATGVGIAAAAAGVWLSGAERQAHRVPRLVLPFSAGVLLGVALFGLLPELALEAGWTATLLLFGAGYALLIAIDRYIYPICPTCAHDHDHNACTEELHGFAAPLVAAAALHSFLDGWSVATAQAAAPLGLRVAVPLAVALHKIPEGMALGGILLAAVPSRPRALAWCVLAEGTTLAGGMLGFWLAPQLGAGWILYPLGLTSGWIFYLGFHAVHEEWKRRGATPAFVSALTGVAGAAAIQRGAEALFR
jgi:zinc transporter ZupT